MSSITILMPMLNVEATIRKCIESVLFQSLQDIEILCIDGGSKDNTLNILQEYKQKDSRITILHSKIRSYGHQINMGIEAATGDYIGIVEADDYISPDMYARLLEVARNNHDPDIVKSGYYSLYRFEVGDDSIAQYPLKLPTGVIFSLNKYRRKYYEILDAHPSIWSCIYRYDFLKENNIRMVEAPGAGWVDNPFFIETLCKAKSIGWVNEPLYYYGESTTSSSTISTDISVILSRLNDMVDIIQREKPDVHFERSILRRAILYISRAQSNSNYSNAYTEEITALLKRFSPNAIKCLSLKEAQFYYSFVPGKEYGIPYRAYLRMKKRCTHMVSLFNKKGVANTISFYRHKVQSKLHHDDNASAADSQKDIPTELHLPAKTVPRVLLIASDNRPASGAFLSMSVLGRILKENYPIEPYVILPNKGPGTAVLDENHLTYCLVPSNDWVLPMALDRDEAVETSILNKKRKNELAIQKIVKIIQENAIDIVHINTTYSYVGAIAAKRAGIPYIWHIREFLEEDQGNTLWDRELGNKLIGQADYVIAISKSIFNKYAAIVPPERLLCIYNGIDAEKFHLPQKTILNDEIVTFIMVGGFQYYKGHLEFANACVELFQRGFYDFKIRFVGHGDVAVIEDVKKNLKQGGILDRAEFLGYQPNVQDYLSTSDISFTCAVSEAFGRTTVEAMLAGNLVIGADTSGTKELIRDGETGYLYKQGDVHSLADTIIKALQDRERSRKIASDGRNEMAATMTAEINAANIYNVYKTVLQEKENNKEKP